VTSVVPSAAPDTARTEKHPYGKSYYSDVDTGEYIAGPIVPCWKGFAQQLSLIATVFEQDDGDPNKYRDKVAQIVAVAAQVVKSVYGVAVPDVVKALVTDALTWVLGSEDDLIETQYVTLTSQQFVAMANTAPQEFQKSGKNTGIRYHMSTRHRGCGADYRVYYAVTK
jgi:hypothetical protein